MGLSLGLLLKKEIELHFKEELVEWHPLDKGGSKNLSFYGKTKSELKFIAKYLYCCRNTIELRKIRKHITEVRCRATPECIGCFLSIIGRFCFLNEWVEGSEIDFKLINENTCDLKECVLKSCKALKEIHSICLPKKAYHRQLEKDYKSALRAIERHNIEVPHFEKFKNYVDENLRNIKSNRQGIVHFDFHPGNIILGANCCKIIDLETACICDPWRDLVYALEINFPEQQRFCLLFLLEYFEGNIPDEFFYISKIYVIVYMLMLAKYNRKGGLATYFLLVEKIYNDYNGLEGDVPKWISLTAQHLVDEIDMYQNSLRELAIDK